MPMNSDYKIIVSKKVSTNKQQGFSLIEVMVSLLLISMGMIALTNLQTRSVNIAMTAYTETQSALYLQEMAQLLRANKKAATDGDYNITLNSFKNIPSNGTSPSLAEVDRYNWFNNMNNTLPNAKASINCDSNARCSLVLEQKVSGTDSKHSLAVIL